MELWAAIDLMDGMVVRLLRGEADSIKVYSSSPIDAALRWEREGADGLHVVDLDAAVGGGDNSHVVGELLKAVRIPVQVGGGLRSMETAEGLFTMNVYRVLLGTLSFKAPSAVKQLVDSFGWDRVIVALDYSLGVVMHGGWRDSTGIKVEDALSKFKSIGVRNFLLTCIERDGTLLGPDLDMFKAIQRIPGVNIFASGGVRSLEDLLKLRGIGVKGVVLGRALYEKTLGLSEAASALARRFG